MITIQNYVKAESLEQAWELNQKRSARVMGGMLWMRLSRKKIQTVIDLSGLGLDGIEETEDAFKIGCMTTLRELENHPGLLAYTDGAVKESVRHIVGVQFRNLATVGGSIFGRYGFSDVLTMFLALDSYVELYKGGVIPLVQFAQMKKDNDILVRVIVKKEACRTAYLSQRNTKTDFPVLTCAVSAAKGRPVKAVIGARPQRAVIVEDESGILAGGITAETAAEFGRYAASCLKFGSNMRASAEYRGRIAEVLVKRACLKQEDPKQKNLKLEGGRTC
ncbi:MAG: FAD binding domain-containing protein [Lachnospiraceae bacterium]|nr:FAD binding domain-containing protein [Lachnospiraceae bacterium]